MQWAKRFAHVKYNLANSGVTNYPLAELPVKLEDLGLTGDSYYGYPPLQEALAEKCEVSTNQIFSTVGTSLANHIAMGVLFQPGDEILIEHPTYELLISTAQYLGYTVRRFPRRFENGFQIDPDDVQKALTPKTRLIVITNLHNPSSALTNEHTLKKIGEVARRSGAHVLVDEVYLDAAFDPSLRSSFHLGSEFIVTNSLTKVYGLSGLRCGWALAEPNLIQKMWYLNDLFNVIPAHPAERLSVIALSHLDQITAWSRSILDHNHRLINRFLNARDDLETVCPGFGTVVFPRLKKGSVGQLERHLLDRYKTSITPGKFFEMSQHFRIGLGCPTNIIESGLHAIGKVLKQLTGKR
jgi:aspartate/methionine/tyrosine aminotransferase